MFIAKVVGNVWATRKHPRLGCSRMMLVRPMDPVTGEFSGEPSIALDCRMDSGPGDTVLVMDEGGSARQMLRDSKAPVRTVICGVVDRITHWKERRE